MEEIKKEINVYSYYDCTGIENHLKKMAEKGWMLKEIMGRNWKYRRIEPRSMSFFVSYYPKKVSFDDMTDDRLKYIDENSVAGWKFVTHIGKMHIFCNESENPVPLHTDAAERVREIHRFAKTNVIFENLFMLAVAAALTTYFAFRFFEKPIDTMSDAAYIFWFMPFAVLLSLYGIFKYLFWYVKAKKSAEDGIFTDTKRIFNYADFYIPLYFTAATLKIYTFLSPPQMIFGVIAIALAVVMWLLFKALRRVISGKDLADEKKKAQIAIAAVGFIAVFVAGSIGVYSLFPARSEKVALPDGGTTEIYYDKNLPVDLEDLIEAEGVVSKYKSFEWLGFASVTETAQSAWDENGDEFYFDCDVYRIHFMPVYDACVTEVQDLLADIYVEVDPVPWGADKVYRIKYEDGYANYFVICKDNIIVKIRMTLPPDETQMSIISEKLFS